MHFMEKLNWAALLVGIAALVWYLFQVAPGVGVLAIDEIAWKGPMLTSLIAFLVILVVLIIVIAIFDHKALAENDIVDDERDHRIERRGDAWSGHVMQAFAFGALILLFIDAHAFWVANTIYLGAMVSGAVGLVIRVAQYRMGG